MAFRTDVFGGNHSFERSITAGTINFIKRWEAFRAKRYPDGKRADGSTVWSIGYGHAEDGDNEPFKIPEDMTLTKEQATAILVNDVTRKARFIDARVKAPLTTFQFGALTSLVFQYGNGRLDKTTVFSLLNGENYIDAAIAMLDLSATKAGVVLRGLRLRRAAEVALFLTKVE